MVLGCMSETASGIGNVCFTPIFIIFVFQCIALTHSDNNTFYDACGHTLRDLMMSNLIILFAFFIFIYFLNCIVGCKGKVLDDVFLKTLYFLISMFEVIMSICILKYGADALNNSVCNDAMCSTEGGVNSISANTGSALLAIIGIVPSALVILIILLLLLYSIIFAIGFLYKYCLMKFF